MDEIHLRVVLSKRQLKLALILCSLLGAAYAAQSDTFTLTALYPSPSGVYKRLISTDQTILARDAGSSVGIGTTNPTSGVKLEVNGAVRIGSLASAPAQNGVLYYDSTLNKLRIYQNGTWVSIGGTTGTLVGRGSQVNTYWTGGWIYSCSDLWGSATCPGNHFACSADSTSYFIDLVKDFSQQIGLETPNPIGEIWTYRYLCFGN